MVWDYFLILFVISLVLCAVGFYKCEFFHTIGYGFAISGIGVALIVLNIMHAFDATWPNYVMFALVIIYGIRLSGFSLLREVEKKTGDKTKTKVPVYWKLIVWLIVSAIYVALPAPLLFTVEGEYGYYPGACMWIGMIICLAGLASGVVADIQKGRQKECVKIATIKEWYRLLYCPDYLGEILFWAGILLSSLDSLQGFAEWVIALGGFICIVIVKGIPYLKKAK